MACFVYEGVVLFGVVMISGYLYGSLTQQRHALQGQFGLRFFLFAVLGVYFTWLWSNGGQTVAMKTWHVRVVTHDGKPLSQRRAFARYLASWVWFLPALALASAQGLQGSGLALAVAAGVALYAATALLHPQRQFWHDALCGTRLVDAKPRPPR